MDFYNIRKAHYNYNITIFVSSVRDQCADDATAADDDVMDKDLVWIVLIEFKLLGDMCSARHPSGLLTFDCLFRLALLLTYSQNFDDAPFYNTFYTL